MRSARLLRTLGVPATTGLCRRPVLSLSASFANQPARYEDIVLRLASDKSLPCPLQWFDLLDDGGTPVTNAHLTAHLLAFVRGERASDELLLPKAFSASDRYNRSAYLHRIGDSYRSRSFARQLLIVLGHEPGREGDLRLPRYGDAIVPVIQWCCARHPCPDSPPHTAPATRTPGYLPTTPSMPTSRSINMFDWMIKGRTAYRLCWDRSRLAQECLLQLNDEGRLRA